MTDVRRSIIAAVAEPRGPDAARALASRLRLNGAVDLAGEIAFVRGGARDSELEILPETTLEAAAARAGSGAFLAADAEHPGALIAGRGAIGGRALYYARASTGAWVACSELAPILEIAPSLRVDADRLAVIAAGVADPVSDRSPVEGVFRAKPCAAVRLASQGVVARDRPENDPPPIQSMRVEDLASELWRRIRSSVRRAVRGADSVAVMLSGGLDSSGILAAALAEVRGAGPRELAALTLDFEATGSDRPYVADLARELGIVPIRLEPRAAGPWFAPSLVQDEQPYPLTIGPMEQLVMTEAKHRGADMLLTGYFGDDVLGGELRTLAIEALSGHPVRAVRRAARLSLPWDTTRRERISAYVLRPIVRPFTPRWLMRLKNHRANARDFPWAGARMRRILDLVVEAGANARAPRRPRDRIARFARSSLFADFADYRSQLEASTDFVRKDPYVDEEILDLVGRAPVEALWHADMHRGLFREALRGKVPESIRMRADKAWFEPAFAEVAAAAGGIEARGDLWDVRELAALEIVDAKRFRGAMAPLFRNATSSADDVAWAWSASTQVLACEQFLRRRRGAG